MCDQRKKGESEGNGPLSFNPKPVESSDLRSEFSSRTGRGPESTTEVEKDDRRGVLLVPGKSHFDPEKTSDLTVRDWPQTQVINPGLVPTPSEEEGVE